MRFLFSRRWLLFALAVGVLTYACVWLGEWQFSRLEERERRNAFVETNVAAAPVPAAQLMGVGEPVAEDEEWRRVVVSGRYDADRTVVLRYATRDGKSGVDLVTPLVTPAGPAVLVDRGWTSTPNRGDITGLDLPAPPPGEVTVVGWVRRDGTGDSTRVTDGSTRAVSSRAIGEQLPYPVYAGFLDAQSEQPAAAEPLVPAEPPELGQGPHFFYGLQWWFFGALAVFGFGYLAYDERRRRRREERGEDQDEARDGDRPVRATGSTRRPRGSSPR